MSEMPCINCITFPICNCQVIEFINSLKWPPIRSKLYLVYCEVLIKKCDLIYQWMNNESAIEGFRSIKYGFIIYQMNKAYKL